MCAGRIDERTKRSAARRRVAADRLVEDEVQHVLAPDPGAIAEALSGHVDHLLGGIDVGEHRGQRGIP
jgi:hypothetical protein